MSRISIIVPALNEAGTIAATLAPLQAWRSLGHEIIVVDGRSTDATRALATPLCDQCLVAGPGRAVQMNAGAKRATGELLLFLHADTALPADARPTLEPLSADATGTWGRFDVTLDAHGFAFRVIESLMNYRSRLTGVATGDQAMFVSRSLFERIGGYPPIALMEDIALSKALRRIRRPVNSSLRVTTSARRWQRDGIARTVATMWALRFAYFCGASPQRLNAFYRSERDGENT